MESYWSATSDCPKFNSLDNNFNCDVCIIGAGITGIATAYMLSKKSNLKICIVDKGEICSGVTQNTTAKITSQHGLIYDYLIKTFGFNFAKDYLNSNEEAISSIKQIIDKEKIDCGFEFQDAYVYTNDTKYIQTIKDEVKAVQSLGFNCEYVDKINLPVSNSCAIKFPNQAKFHPLKYLFALAKILEKNNVKIFTNSKVTNIKHANGLYEISANGHKITATYTVCTTHYPIKNFPGIYFLKMYQDRSYAILVETNHKMINRNVSFSRKSYFII